jgi:subtilase family serine protease
MRSPRARHGALAAAALAASWLVAMPPAAAAPAAPAGSPPAVAVVPQHPGPRGVPTVQHPLLVKVRGRGPDGRPLYATGAPGGYTATELRAYLRLTGTGAGQTVAIVDAFDDPYAASDVNAYSAQFGLPRACAGQRTGKCFSLRVVHPFGNGGLDTGWVLEESLDVDMVHAVAPDASIVLVEARSNTNTAMFRALGYAAGLHPAVISNSWGTAEFPKESRDDHYCRLASAVCTFSTGDAGNPGEYPAYSPDVIAVGGTELSLTAAGGVVSETGWTEGFESPGTTGGGVSAYEPRPAYQDHADRYAGRGTPDVSFDADPTTGVAVYSAALGGWLEVGGTSVGAPAWAGILAAADQLRAAAGAAPLAETGHEAQKALYHLASGLYDVTTGSNGACGAICTAGPGYDFVTGLGSPRPGIDTALAVAP